MSDFGRGERERERERERESLGDIVDGAARRIGTGIMIAGAAVALAIYARPGPPRYQAIPTDTGIVRVDTRSGTVLHCVANGCYVAVRRGQQLLDGDERRAAREKAYGEPEEAQPPAPKALPAPQPQDAQPANAQ